MTQQFILTSAGLRPADCDHNNAQESRPSSELGSGRSTSAQPMPKQEETAFPSLRDIAKEVHALGARHLDSKHDAASFSSNRLTQIGIKLPKKQRVAASHGVLSLKKAKKREQQQEQQLINSGFLAIRGKGKLKAKRLKAAKGSKDHGLNEVKGFKAGLLKVHTDGSKKRTRRDSKGRKGTGRRD